MNIDPNPTRPNCYRGEAGEVCQSVPRTIEASDRSSISSWMDNSTNKPMPYLVLIAIVACSLSGVGLGLSIGARDTANNALKIAERETRLQRLETDELKVALKAQGIKLHED